MHLETLGSPGDPIESLRELRFTDLNGLTVQTASCTLWGRVDGVAASLFVYSRRQLLGVCSELALGSLTKKRRQQTV